MLSSVLLLISITALLQFAVYYWRAVVAGVAAQPISDRVLAAAGLADSHIAASHFDKLSGLHDITPNLERGQNGLGLVRLYYQTMRLIGKMTGSRLPAVFIWSQRERVVCARYAAVQIGRRLDASLAMAASVRSC
jgi:hypothetical protein